VSFFVHARMKIVRMKLQDKPVQLVTRRELSDRWKLSVETLKRRERCGVLRVLKLGRGVRYRLADIQRLEADAEVRQPAATIGGAAI
jgi:hypothetical protein